jgi:hypothetical protein
MSAQTPMRREGDIREKKKLSVFKIILIVFDVILLAAIIWCIPEYALLLAHM